MQIPPESETSPQYPAAPEMQVPHHSSVPKIRIGVVTPSKASDFNSPAQNIILFGETGVGKSSIINMLQGEEVAITSSNAHGCTSKNTCHEVTLASPSGEKKYRLWDTTGLNEGDKGTVPAQQAISNLITLVMQLSAHENGAGGVRLLVYCIRGTRLREIIRINYDLFWSIICKGQVPIVLVITGLENEDDMDSWWGDNRHELEDDLGMMFEGHACVTSTRGKLEKSGSHMFEEEYRASVGKVRTLLESTCSLQSEPLKIDGDRWIADITRSLDRYLWNYNQRTEQEWPLEDVTNDYQEPRWISFLKQFLNRIFSVLDDFRLADQLPVESHYVVNRHAPPQDK